jgi:hypothetical protein
MALITLAAGVFSVCTLDGCWMYPPLRYFPPPINYNRQFAPVPPGATGGIPVLPRPQLPPAALSQDQEREFIIKQGQAFCDKYPRDRMCHWQNQEGAPPQ